MPRMLLVLRWTGVLVLSIPAFIFANLLTAEWRHGYAEGDGVAWAAVVTAGGIFLACLVAICILVSPEFRRLKERFKV